MPNAQHATLPMDTDNRLTVDLPCVGCGYSLRSRLTTDACPECGQPVTVSMQSRWFLHAPQRWINRVRNGWALTILAPLLAMLSVCACWLTAIFWFFMRAGGGEDGMVYAFVIWLLFLQLLLAIGITKSTSSRGDLGPSTGWARLQRTVVLAMVWLGLFWTTTLSIMVMTESFHWIEDVDGTTTSIIAAVMIVLLLMTASTAAGAGQSLATSIPRKTLATQFRVGKVALLVFGLIALGFYYTLIYLSTSYYSHMSQVSTTQSTAQVPVPAQPTHPLAMGIAPAFPIPPAPNGQVSTIQNPPTATSTSTQPMGNGAVTTTIQYSDGSTMSHTLQPNGEWYSITYWPDGTTVNVSAMGRVPVTPGAGPATTTPAPGSPPPVINVDVTWSSSASVMSSQSAFSSMRTWLTVLGVTAWLCVLGFLVTSLWMIVIGILLARNMKKLTKLRAAFNETKRQLALTAPLPNITPVKPYSPPSP
ncbi:MAG: hypothetical protein GC164_00115 [Phycisphaera sp.]|nr:hypothetical protein [Phycisphaera sp.]